MWNVSGQHLKNIEDLNIQCRYQGKIKYNVCTSTCT